MSDQAATVLITAYQTPDWLASDPIGHRLATLRSPSDEGKLPAPYQLSEKSPILESMEQPQRAAR